MKTILITGCSSGFGLDAATRFHERGWNVIATMRRPDPSALPASQRLRILPLDVTDPASIDALAAEAGPIDVLVNNAGVGLAGIVEGTTLDTVRATFETNTFGAIAVIRAFLPQLRAAKGTIVNISSSVTMLPLPLLAIYTASKAALNAFTECLALELASVGVTVKLVLPGRSPETSFSKNAMAHGQLQGVAVPDEYAGFMQEARQRLMANRTAPVTRSADVTDAIWRAVTDPAGPTRIPAGADAVALANRFPAASERA
jgi:NAD(P)-dependent dehydrogenase (short-subunit alcohol dehydrogenase family)